MTDQGSKRPRRSSAAAHFDAITLAAFTVALVVTVAAVFAVGIATAEDRLGCGLNDLVNGLLAYPRACR